MNPIRVAMMLALALAVAGCAVDRSNLATPEALRDLPPPPEPMTFDEPPEMMLEEGIDYRAVIETNKGTINLDLFEDEAPVTVNNFVFLAQQGFYDGVPFHRVVPDFVIQGGDRNGTATGQPGTGGPGYTWDDEESALEIPHDSAGTLSMANAGPDTNGSQFFITHVPTPHLDGMHAVFGEVVSEADMDIVNAIRQGDVMLDVTITEDAE